MVKRAKGQGNTCPKPHIGSEPMKTNIPEMRKRHALDKAKSDLIGVQLVDNVWQEAETRRVEINVILEQLADDLTKMENPFTGLSTATLFSAYAKAMGRKSRAAMYRQAGQYGIAIGEDFWAKEYQRRDRLTMKLGKVIEWRLGGNANRPEICMRCGCTFGRHDRTCSRYGENR